MEGGVRALDAPIALDDCTLEMGQTRLVRAELRRAAKALGQPVAINGLARQACTVRLLIGHAFGISPQARDKKGVHLASLPVGAFSLLAFELPALFLSAPAL